MAKTLICRDSRSLVRWSSFLVLACLPAVACTSDSPLDPASELELNGVAADALQLPVARAGGPNTVKATGSVAIEWPGGKGKVIPPGEEKLAFAEFEAFPATMEKDAKGSFTYRVLNADLSPHREIIAKVIGAYVALEEDQMGKAWFVGEVISDIKICGGCGGGGEHPDGGGGCSGGGEHPDDGGGCSGGGESPDGGGCSDGGESPDEGGCSGEDHTTEGGCSGSGGPPGGTGEPGGMGGPTDGVDHGTDGGCGGGEEGGEEGGCGGEEGGEEGGCEGGGGSGGGHGGSGGIPGKDPRVGQFIVVKVHDKATPGAGENGDGITWKWFAPDDERLLGILSQIEVEPKKGLCKKTIIGGNLVVQTGAIG